MMTKKTIKSAAATDEVPGVPAVADVTPAMPIVGIGASAGGLEAARVKVVVASFMQPTAE